MVPLLFIRVLKWSAFVDLNYLFYRQQVERTLTENADCEEARSAHEELARRYEKQIESSTGEEFKFPKDE